MRDSKHFYLLIFREINHLLRSLLQKKLSESLIQKAPLFLKHPEYRTFQQERR